MLSVVLIPLFGVAGAAVAISGAMILEAVLLYAVAKYRLGLHVFIWRPKSAEPTSGLFTMRMGRSLAKIETRTRAANGEMSRE